MTLSATPLHNPFNMASRDPIRAQDWPLALLNEDRRNRMNREIELPSGAEGIIAELAKREMTVTDLARVLRMSIGAVTDALWVLARNGRVKSQLVDGVAIWRADA